MINADRIIASLIIISSLYFMWHAVALPIGWNGIEGGPGSGHFRLAIFRHANMLWHYILAVVLGQNFKFSFDTSMIKPILLVAISLIVLCSDIFYWCIYSDIFIFVLVSQGDQQAFIRVIFNYFRFDPNNDVLLF